MASASASLLKLVVHTRKGPVSLPYKQSEISLGMKINDQIACRQKNLLYLEATIGRYKVSFLLDYFSFHLVFWGYWEATVLPLFCAWRHHFFLFLQAEFCSPGVAAGANTGFKKQGKNRPLHHTNDRFNKLYEWARLATNC